jgi:hypothetical protein
MPPKSLPLATRCRLTERLSTSPEATPVTLERPSEKLGRWWSVAAIVVGGTSAAGLLLVRALQDDPARWLEQVSLTDVAGPLTLTVLAVGALLRSLGSDVQWSANDRRPAAALTRFGKWLYLASLAYSAWIAFACWLLPFLMEESAGLVWMGFAVAVIATLVNVWLVLVGARRINDTNEANRPADRHAGEARYQ